MHIYSTLYHLTDFGESVDSNGVDFAVREESLCKDRCFSTRITAGDLTKMG
jgi:hypothetical protein